VVEHFDRDDIAARLVKLLDEVGGSRTLTAGG
jgi:hypothetical protein